MRRSTSLRTAVMHRLSMPCIMAGPPAATAAPRNEDTTRYTLSMSRNRRPSCSEKAGPTAVHAATLVRSTRCTSCSMSGDRRLSRLSAAACMRRVHMELGSAMRRPTRYSRVVASDAAATMCPTAS